VRPGTKLTWFVRRHVRRVAPGLLACALVLVTGSASRAEDAAAATQPSANPAGTELSRQALDLCHRARQAPEAEKKDLLAQSLARSDDAIAADDDDALAHFAQFCALGEQARLDGASVTNLFRVRSIRRSVDRTLELAPNFSDALVGKGTLLLSIPGFLGGDVDEGERLLRRAIELEPDYFGARMRLAEALADSGRKSEARAEAERALATAERKADAGDMAAARQLLDTLKD
jgi:tetratricopeptide (TPR) repeat protein